MQEETGEEEGEKSKAGIAKTNKAKNLFFEKIKWQTVSQTHQETKGENQINKITTENGEIIIDNTEIQRIIRDYYQQLDANKMDNLEEMDKFLEKYNFPKLNQEEIENLTDPSQAQKSKL